MLADHVIRFKRSLESYSLDDCQKEYYKFYIFRCYKNIPPQREALVGHFQFSKISFVHLIFQYMLL